MYRSLILFSIFVCLFVQSNFGQNSIKKLKKDIPHPVCYASPKINKTYTPPPAEFRLKSQSENKSEIIVDYSQFPTKAKVAFEFAVNIWEQLIESEIPIYIEANWRTMDEKVLGSAGPTDFYTDFNNIPHTNRYYPVSVVEKITKTEITGAGSPDIVSTFNQNTNWYFGIDGSTPDSLYDFVTVVLHEIAHGLGFTGFLQITNNKGEYDFFDVGDASAYDLLVVNRDNHQLVDTTFFQNQSDELKTALTSNKLYANSPAAKFHNNNNKPKIYAPSTFDDGSSIYHLDHAHHPNDLMTHAIGKAEAVHDPGELTLGILADIGWKHMYIDHKKPKDIEQIKPIRFDVAIESDYQLKSNSQFVVYSFDKFNSHIDTLPLLQSEPINLFTGTLNPEPGTSEIEYFISSSDIKNRTFKHPTEAPKEIHKITIGPDEELPKLTHEAIPYFVLAGENLPISTLAEDNVGIDRVYVEYTINGIPQPSFNLEPDSATRYSGTFNLNLELLNDGDEIAYNIVAKDSSQKKNTSKIPLNDSFRFKVEKIFDPVERYMTDFNQTTQDFVISDFGIYTETNFENGALHSPHPYPSPDKNNTYWNFTTLLKHPIILSENAKMTFDEVVLVEPGEYRTEFNDDEFWDYVIIEGSLDNGNSWLPFANGYDSRDNEVWEDNYNLNIDGNNSQTTGSANMFFPREIDLLENENFLAGDTVLIRFRLFSDPYAHGWGWTIDNLRIQIPVSSPLPTFSSRNVSVYPNPFRNRFKVSVQTNKAITELKYEVFNIFGQKIITTKRNDLNGQIMEEIDLRNHADGLYFITIVADDNKVYSGKVLKATGTTSRY